MADPKDDKPTTSVIPPSTGQSDEFERLNEALKKPRVGGPAPLDEATRKRIAEDAVLDEEAQNRFWREFQGLSIDRKTNGDRER